MRSVAIGYLIRRLAAQCTNRHVIQRRSQSQKPVQLSVGVAVGPEAAVYATRRLLSEIHPIM